MRMTTHQAETIAAALSLPQQRAVILMDDRGWVRRGGREYSAATMRVLHGRGIAISRKQESEWQLNALGMAVQDVLRPRAIDILHVQ